MKLFVRRGIKASYFKSLGGKKMNAKSLLIAGAVATLLVTGAVNARADQSAGADQVKCVGVNSCKGQSSCKSAQNDCKGKNGCKGQGFVPMSAQECKDKGGTVGPSDSK
jgi:uncharacterized membrane protein